MTGARVCSNTSRCVEKDVKTLSKAKVLRSVRAPAPLMTQISFFSVDAVTTGSVFPLSSRSLIGRRRTTTWMLDSSAIVVDVSVVRSAKVWYLARGVRASCVCRRGDVRRASVISPATGSETSRSAILSRHEEKTAAGHDVVRVSAGRKIDQATIPTARTVREKRKSPSNQSAPNGRFAKNRDSQASGALSLGVRPIRWALPPVAGDATRSRRERRRRRGSVARTRCVVDRP